MNGSGGSNGSVGSPPLSSGGSGSVGGSSGMAETRDASAEIMEQLAILTERTNDSAEELRCARLKL